MGRSRVTMGRLKANLNIQILDRGRKKVFGGRFVHGSHKKRSPTDITKSRKLKGVKFG